MKSFTGKAVHIGVFVALVAVIVLPASFHAQQGKGEQELLQLERDWCSAALKSDPIALGRILADDYTSVSREGKVTNKTEDLAGVKANKVTACDVDLMKARIYGDAGVVIGRSTIKGTAFTGQHMWTDTFNRRDGRWQCVATQSTEIKK
jgi:hypothetical protein